MSIHKLSVAGRKCVGIAGMHVAKEPKAEIVTYALGSCLGITMHDPVAKVGGLVHVMLPDSTIDATKAAKQPGMFVDTGVPALLGEMQRAGASRSRLRIAVAGGAAQRMAGKDMFQIGERNWKAFEALMASEGLRILAADVGGANLARTMTLAVETGSVEIKSDGAAKKLVP